MSPRARPYMIMLVGSLVPDTQVRSQNERASLRHIGGPGKNWCLGDVCLEFIIIIVSF